MKKFISILLSVLIILLSMSLMFPCVAAEYVKTDLERFTQKVTRLIRESEISDDGLITANSDDFGNSKKDAAESRVIVKSAEKIDTLNAVGVAEGYNDLHILQFSSQQEADSALEYYKSLDCVIYAQKDNVVSELEVEDGQDSGIVYGQAVSNPMPSVTNTIGITALQNHLNNNHVSYTDEITVAILDSGIESTHEMFEGRLIPSDFNVFGGDSAEDDRGHGTHVAGIVVANSLNNVKVKAYKVLNKEGKGADSEVVLGIEAAIADGVDVMNMSFGNRGESAVIDEAVKKAYAAGITVVVSAGNSSTNLSDYSYYPASIPECITVMSCRNDLSDKASTTNYGGACDVAAPGVNIKSSWLNNTYKVQSGTSMAAPYVAAAATYVMLDDSSLTNAEIEAKLQKYSIPFKNSGGVGCIYMEYITRELSKTPAPVFSVRGCEFTENFTVELSCSDTGVKIYYRTSNMPEDAQELYKEPIKVSTDVEITAWTYKKGLLLGDSVTEKYTRIFPDEDSKYEITAKGEITTYYLDEEEIVIPQVVKGITVKSIGKNVFAGKNMTRVILPDTVQKIEYNAFGGCQSLEYVRASSVWKIDGSFQNCKNLEMVNCPNLQLAGSKSFYECSNLKYVNFKCLEFVGSEAFKNVYGIYSVVSDKLTDIGSDAFYHTQIRILDAPNLVKIAERAFYDCNMLETAIITNTDLIEKEAFYNNTSLKEVVASKVTTIRDYAFYNCASLKILNFPILKQIGQFSIGNGSTFAGCSSLENIIAPALLYIGIHSFKDCSALKGISFPLVENISNGAFENCSAITQADLPNLRRIDFNVFSGCTSLKVLEFPALQEIVAVQSDSMTVDWLILDKAENIGALPDNCNVLLPSTVRSITAETPTNTTVWATEGTYAYNWAQENGLTVKQITQETALLNDAPMTWSDGDGLLMADAVGFNRTYQWYGNTIEDNSTGTPFAGATDKMFNPADYPAADYYYCIITSTDVGCDPVKIRTGIAIGSDYSAVYAALETVPEDLSLYSNATATRLQKAINSVKYDLPLSDQATVDKYAKDISNAVSSLVYKSADYTEYDAAVKEARAAVNSGIYKDTSAVSSALSVNVQNKNITEQSVVDEQTAKIWQALNALVKKPADYTEYNKAVKAANTAITNNPDKDLTALRAALAEDVRGKYIDEQDIVDKQTQKILLAVDALDFVSADYTEYNEAVLKGKEAVNSGLYKDVSKLNYELSVNVSGKRVSEQAQVDAQTKAILNAINALKYKDADYTEYNKAVAKARALDKTLYTNYSLVTNALSVNVSGKNITQQNVVDSQTQKILSAISSLRYRDADYTEYNKAVSKAAEVNPELYTDESWSVLDEAVSLNVSGKNITEQEIVDKQAKVILDAISALKYRNADYTAYNEAVQRANELDRDLYKDLSVLDAVIAADISGKDITEQEIVDERTNIITAALNALQYKDADYTEYNKAVRRAIAVIESSDGDVTALKEAIAVDVSGKNITEQDIVDNQTAVILNTIDNLDMLADYTEYFKTVKQAESLDLSLYKDTTELEAALAVDVSGLLKSEQEAVDNQTAAIAKAISSLEYKDADYTAYNEAVERANSLDRNLYNDLTVLDAILAIDVSGKNITEQAVVDAQTNVILNAVIALENQPADYTAYDEAVNKANALDRNLYKDLTALDEALAVDVSGKIITEQALVNAQTEAIINAINALELKSADYTEYDRAVIKAQTAINSGLYKDVSALEAELEVDVSSKPAEEQTLVDAQTEAILNAINALKYKPADFTEYNKAVIKAQEAINSGLYKDLTAVTNALSKDVSNKNITEQADVDKQTDIILNAINALQYRDADYTAYNEAVNKAQEAVDSNLYKDVTAVNNALRVDVSNKNLTEQSVVDAQTEAILDAINSLVYKDADYAAYDKAVQRANNVDGSLYENIQELYDALSVDVSGKNITEQEAVDIQTKAIIDAVNALRYKDADYTAYNEAVNKAQEAVDSNLYKDVTAVNNALRVDVSGKNITEQEAVDAQTKAILDAIASLVYRDADYTAYNETVSRARSAIDSGLYKDVTALNATLAVDISGKNITEQALIDAQTNAIIAVMNSLEYKSADYTEYDEAVRLAKAVDTSLYANSDILENALSADVSGKNISEQEAVDAQTKAILNAIDGLRLIGDVNGEGAVTVADAKLILQYIVEAQELDETAVKAADINGDGIITIADARLVLIMTAENA